MDAVAESGGNGLLLEETTSRVDDFLAGEYAVALPSGSWTTREMLAIEAEVLALATSTRSVPAPDSQVVDKAIDARPSLSEEQRRAVRSVTDGATVSLIVGHAGAGKTFALDAARSAWKAGGQEVVGCSLSARAARQLQSSAGILSDTADKLLADLDGERRKLTSRSAVVCDEAGIGIMPTSWSAGGLRLGIEVGGVGIMTTPKHPDRGAGACLSMRITALGLGRRGPGGGGREVAPPGRKRKPGRAPAGQVHRPAAGGRRGANADAGRRWLRLTALRWWG